MLILKNLSIADIAFSCATKTRFNATLILNGRNHEKPHEKPPEGEVARVQVFSMAQDGNDEYVVVMTVEYQGPEKQRKDPNRTITDRKTFVFDMRTNIATEKK